MANSNSAHRATKHQENTTMIQLPIITISMVCLIIWMIEKKDKTMINNIKFALVTLGVLLCVFSFTNWIILTFGCISLILAYLISVGQYKVEYTKFMEEQKKIRLKREKQEASDKPYQQYIEQRRQELIQLLKTSPDYKKDKLI